MNIIDTRILASCLLCCVASFAPARSPLVLMCLAAHPDDEDGATLAYYHAVYGITTYSVFFTRGDGGQNEIGPELYKDLAVIRTKETQNASRIVGSEALFLNLHDFGYSKTALETYKFWGGHDEVLRRLVYMIRRLKPDVIITNHNPAPEDGENHGNHQVVAIEALAAMNAAADSTYHPEQLRDKDVTTWTVHKLFMRVWDYRDTVTASAPGRIGYSSLPDVYVPVGKIEAGSKMPFQQIANLALREHHSQGMEFFQSMVKPEARIWYKLTQADAGYPAMPDNLFGGIIPSDRTISTDPVEQTLPPEFTSLQYLDAVQPRTYPLGAVTVRPGLSVGVIESYDNTLRTALDNLHVATTMLDSSMIAGDDLSAFGTILIDIRAYSKRPDLVAHYQRLKEYVVRGGNLVVFYQKTMEWRPEYAPFPIKLTRLRVTDEHATVVALKPNDAFFHAPNEIKDSDWDGWVVERGLYFPEETQEYSMLAASGDPGEMPLFTGLLKARYGNGLYTYCALSLYRQLRLQHPGAYKMFANLISAKPGE